MPGRSTQSLDISQMGIGAFPEYPAVLGALIVLNWPLYRALFLVLFRDIDEAKRSFWWFLVRSDAVSIFRGEFFRDLDKSSKAALLVFSCLVVVSAEYAAVASVVSWLLQRGTG